MLLNIGGFFELASDPPPDLAIEIDITSLLLPRLPIYPALGGAGVWRFDSELLMFSVARATS